MCTKHCGTYEKRQLFPSDYVPDLWYVVYPQKQTQSMSNKTRVSDKLKSR